MSENRQKLYITVLDGSDSETSYDLGSFSSDYITFGRDAENDIVIPNPIVSKRHGYFRYAEGRWVVFDDSSTNGIMLGGIRVPNKRLLDGDKLIIGSDDNSEKICLLVSEKLEEGSQKRFDFGEREEITVGRSPECDICVPHPAVFKQHCKITRLPDGSYVIERMNQKASVQYNGADMPAKQVLREMDRFLIGDTQFIYRGSSLYYLVMEQGLSLEVNGLYKNVGRGKRKKCLNENVGFSVSAGEFTAIIGGSGAGKSTLLKCLCGSSKISAGKVTIGGEDLTSGLNSLKTLIGYVPQSDIVYDNLTLERMLYYTAKLRIPEDYGEAEINERIDSALETVKLSECRGLLIKNLSGGQKKRASIAVELISDPKLCFLDEPTSGLDPGTERNLMLTLKEMSQSGKTVVLVTHSPLNLSLCDKILVMGRGGRLCYCGSPDGALKFFGVDSFVGIYDLVNVDSEKWSEKYRALFPESEPVAETRKPESPKKISSFRQLVILTKRYAELSVHDLKRLMIQLLMAPGLAILLFLAFNSSYPFVASSDTQKLALTLSCCAFWIGLFNTIQEICKESAIYHREQMANLRTVPYIFSKLIVNAVFEIVQTVLLLSVVIIKWLPEEGMQIPGAPALEIYITTYLTMLSATCIGLAVSAIVQNPDQAISAAPILLIPQILFSGLVVELEGIVDKISYIISCRYSCTAICTTANINNLPDKIKLTALGQEAGDVVMVSSRYSYYDSTNSLFKSIFGESAAHALTNPVMGGWLALIIICIVATVAAVIVLYRNKKIN